MWSSFRVAARALVALTVVGVGLAGTLEAAELGSASLPILGSRFSVSPEAQTVPFETPTVIETHVDGADSGTVAVGDLVGPEISGFLRIEARCPVRLSANTSGTDFAARFSRFPPISGR